MGDEKEQEMHEYLDTLGKTYNDFMTGPYAAGENLTWIDFTMFELLDQMEFMSGNRMFALYPNLKAHRSNMEKLPRFGEYWANNAQKRPFKMPGAKLNN